MKNINKTYMFVFLGLIVLIVIATVKLGNIGSLSKLQSAAVISADLSTSTNFAILAGSEVVDSNLSVINGNVGLSPASGSFLGVSCPELVTGTIYATDAASAALCAISNPGLLTQAKNDLTTAYNVAANETPATTLPDSDNQLGGKTLTSGIYTFSAATANLIGTLTLDGGGDPNSVFVFQTASSFITNSGSSVNLINGAQSCNVFWQVGSSATLGTGTHFVGTIMADQSITDSGGSTVDGRLLARIGTVTINNTHVNIPTCTTTPPPAPKLTANQATNNITNTTGRIGSIGNLTPPAVAGSSTPPPLIHVIKVPNPLELLTGGGTVNYTETITNPGTVALSNVNLSDDKCSPVKYISGDVNNNSKLDTNESWKYTCQSYLEKTTTNTATATGEANGLIASDFATVTVVVSVPGLPKTGFPPKGK